jgi:hypothetical protein
VESAEIMPTLIYRAVSDNVQIVVLEHRGVESLLVFMSPEQAEAFRSDTDLYPGSEGFSVTTIGIAELRAIIEVWEYKKVALRGPEPGKVIYLESDDFIEILKEQAELLLAAL